MKELLRKLLGVKSPSGELTMRDHKAMAKAAMDAGELPLPEEWPSFVLPEISEAGSAGAMVPMILGEKPKFREPPSGWYSFGTHAGWDSGTIPVMDFSEEEDDGGMPLWEKPRGWVPIPEPVGPMTGEQMDVAVEALGTAIADHWAEHDGGPSSAEDSCDEFCTARAAMIFLEQEAERQEEEDARRAHERIPTT